MSFAQAVTPCAPRARSFSAPVSRSGPQIRKKYAGTIVFTHGEYGDIVPIRTSFPLLPASAAFQDHLQEFVAERALSAGTVYKFEGTYMLFKNGRPSFCGHISEVSC